MKHLTIITGHYGSGKTNAAVNLALMAKQAFPDSPVRIADLDIVNPYFRTADSRALLEEAGVEVLIPEFANTNVDIPSLPPRLFSLFDKSADGYTIIDVGGDDGAVALGMYSDRIKECGYDMLCVVNMYRPLISDPADAVSGIREIEESSRLSCTGIINNSNLGVETTEDDIISSIGYGEKCADNLGVPLVYQTYEKSYAPGVTELYPEDKRSILLPISDITRKLY